MSESNGTTTARPPDTLIPMSHALQVFAEMFQRLTMTRAGITFSGRRDLYETLGYLRTLRYEDYYQRYRRGCIASRIIDAFPAATWRPWSPR